MSYKYSMIIVSLLLIFSIGSVCAQDNNTDVISAGTEVSIDNNLLQNNLDDNSLVKLTNENVNDTLKTTANDELAAGNNNWYVNGSVATSGDGSENSPFKTLKEAVSSSQSGDTINIASGTYTGENNTNLTISNNLNLIKYGNAEAIFDAQYLSEILIVNAETLTVNGLTFKNGKTTRMINGGAINFKNKGTVINCIFTNNTAQHNGGAVYFGNNGTVINSNFTKNSADIGGAVYFEDNGTVINSIFTNNSAAGDLGAGAVYFNSNGNVTDSNFNNNFAFRASAIRFRCNGTVTNSNFNNNTGSLGGAILFYSGGNVTNCNFTNNWVSAVGGAILFYRENFIGYVNACNFINNSAGGSSKGWAGDGDGGAIRSWGYCIINYCNFTNNTAKPSNLGQDNNVDGGAISSSSGEVVNCNFIGNTALEGRGGAILFSSAGNVTNCIFTNNTAQDNGGAIYFSANGNVTDCIFTNNTAQDNGGAVYFNSNGNVINSNFTKNSADIGGAVYFEGNGTVINSIFTNNSADFGVYYQGGGAVYFNSNGNVTDSKFNNNFAFYAGAINFRGNGTVTNSNFNNNSEGLNAGAILFNSAGNVTNCNFTNNYVHAFGGAILFDSLNSVGYVNACNFINNSAGGFDSKGRGSSGSGGAVYFRSICNVMNCNFTNNTAIPQLPGSGHSVEGGAISSSSGEVVNCNFICNTALEGRGGAIVFRGAGNVTNSNFEGNNASSGSAIYYSNPSSTKIIYNSIFLNNRADSDAVSFVRNKGFGIQFTGNDNLINAIYSTSDVSFTNVTYWGVNGIMNTDSSTVSRSNNEAGQNITVEIYIDGVLDSNITAVTDADGIAYVSLIRDANYTVNAYHIGDSYYTNTDTVTLNFYKGSYTDLQSMIDNCTAGDTLYLPYNITFNPAYDLAADNPYHGRINFNEGMLINKALTIDGYGYTISGLNQSRIFNVNVDNVVLNNISFVNGFRSDYSGANAVYFNGNGTVTNCNFTNIRADWAGAVEFEGDGVVTNCIFTNSSASTDGGAIVFRRNGNLTFSTFVNCSSRSAGGAVYFDGNATVDNCIFKDNRVISDGGAIYLYSSNNIVSNCVFINNTAKSTGGAITISKKATIYECEFYNNRGGAITAWNNASIVNCNFTNNSGYFGARACIDFHNGGTVDNCNFIGNHADQEESTGIRSAGAIYVSWGSADVINCNFTNNYARDYGGAIDFQYGGTIKNCIFYNNSVQDGATATAVYIDSGNTLIEDSIFAANGLNTGYAIYNKGNLTLSNNEVSNIIYNVGNIASLVNVVLNSNKTLYKNIGDVVVLNATLTDGDSNAIYDPNFRIAAGGNNVTDIEYNETTRLYTVDYIIPSVGDIIISTLYDNGDINVLIGIYKDKENVTLIVDADTNIHIGENATINVTLPEDALGNITVLNITVPVINGTASVVLTNMARGNHTVSVIYSGDSKYNPNQTEVVISVSKIPTEIRLENDNIALNITDSVGTGASLIPADAGNLTYNVSNSSVVKVENGKIIALSVGNAIITVSFAGNIKYESASNKTINVTVSLKDASVSVDKNSTFIKVNDSYIIGYITCPDGLNVTFISSDESIATVDANGVVRAIAEGDAIITLSVGGDGVYAFNSTAVAVSVRQDIPKENATMNITADKITVGENLTINVELPIDATGNVTAVIEGKEYSSSVVNGTATIMVPGLSAGNYTVPVFYSGDDKYNPLTQEINVTVEDIPTVVINAPDVVKYYNGPERFVVNVTDFKGNPLVNKKVNITINGVSYIKTTDSMGIVSIALNLNSGQYNVTTTVDNQSVSSNVIVFSTVNGTDITKVYRNATQYWATFLDSEGNYLKEGTLVVFNINGVFYEHEITGDKGLAELNINLPPGEYIITVMNLVTGENDANIINVTSRIVDNNDIIKYYRNGTQYTVKLIGDDGNPVGAGEIVTFNINGVLYNRTTNESGIAKLNINLPAGNYIITAEYKRLNMSNNICVLPVLTANDLVKEYGSPDQFVATLVDGQGKTYANQKIEFNINGVFYIRTTDSAGEAKLNINLPVGEYIITSKYENGATTSNKITVKS